MAKINPSTLPFNTQIELIAIRGDEVFKKIISFEDSLKIKKKKGWTYIRYQIGFSQFKSSE